jgi:GDPmannose 4,6-dehydratase
VLHVIRSTQPDEIYSLAGQTSVGLSFDQPFEAFESIAVGTLNFLEAIRMLGTPCRSSTPAAPSASATRPTAS